MYELWSWSHLMIKRWSLSFPLLQDLWTFRIPALAPQPAARLITMTMRHFVFLLPWHPTEGTNQQTWSLLFAAGMRHWPGWQFLSPHQTKNLQIYHQPWITLRGETWWHPPELLQCPLIRESSLCPTPRVGWPVGRGKDDSCKALKHNCTSVRWSVITVRWSVNCVRYSIKRVTRLNE